MQQRHNHKKGFNLIEAAVVLAVVGAVIGGIWVAAATMYENYRVNKTVEGILFFKSRGAEVITHNMRTGTDYSITAFAREANLLPEDWIIKNGTCATGTFCITTPLDHKAEIRLSNPGVYRIVMFMAPKECIKVVSSVTAGATSSSNIYQIHNWDGPVISSFPTNLTNITSMCRGSFNDVRVIDFRFNIVRNN